MKLSRIMKYIPMGAPIPEGYAVYLAITREMDWSPIVAVVAAIIVAGTGFWGVNVWIRMTEFNATLFKDETNEKMTVPAWKAVLVLMVWFTGVTLITVFLDVWPLLKVWTPIGLVVIGFSASYLFGLSNLMETREQERVSYRQKKETKKEEEKREKKEERKLHESRRQEMAILRQRIGGTVQGKEARKHAKSGSKLTPEMLIMEWIENPYLTDSEMAGLLVEKKIVKQVSRQAVAQRRQKMIKDGLIVQNPDGMVVVYLEGMGEGQAVGEGRPVEMDQNGGGE